MYIVIEMQNGYVENRAWPYEDRESAEVKYYQVLSETVKSTVTKHTVMLMTDEGFVLDCKFYEHEATEPVEPVEGE